MRTEVIRGVARRRSAPLGLVRVVADDSPTIGGGLVTDGPRDPAAARWRERTGPAPLRARSHETRRHPPISSTARPSRFRIEVGRPSTRCNLRRDVPHVPAARLLTSPELPGGERLQRFELRASLLASFVWSQPALPHLQSCRHSARLRRGRRSANRRLRTRACSTHHHRQTPRGKRRAAPPSGSPSRSRAGSSNRTRTPDRPAQRATRSSAPPCSHRHQQPSRMSGCILDQQPPPSRRRPRRPTEEGVVGA